jgi:hypothetical protein
LTTWAAATTFRCSVDGRGGQARNVDGGGWTVNKRDEWDRLLDRVDRTGGERVDPGRQTWFTACAVCGEAPPAEQSVFTLAEGWLNIREAGHQGSLDVCSWACLVTLAAARNAENQP